MTQGNSSIKIVDPEHEHAGRAGRVISAYPYAAEGAEAGAPPVIDVILDADDEGNDFTPIDGLPVTAVQTLV